MAERIFTLFGEEIIPEQINAVGKSRAKKKSEEKKPEAAPEILPVAETPPVTKTPVAAAPVVTTKPEKTKQKRELESEIVLPEEWTGDKQYYSIGEVAELFKVKTSHIRFWTNEFKLKVRTTRKGDRLFTPAQVQELRGIHHLVKERGFTLAGAKAKLKEMNNMVHETIDLKQSMLQLRNKLLIIRNQLV